MRDHLEQKSDSNLESAHRLGRHAMSMGLETLDIARIHERALIEVSSTCKTGAREVILRRAGTFFAEAIMPIEKTHRTALEANEHLSRLNKTLEQRSEDLAVSKRGLKQGIVQRKAAEEKFKKNGADHARLLEELRQLNHQILSAQENDRKKISGELHDETAQTLLGINVRLLSLKREALLNDKRLEKDIASTQRLVEKSAKTLFHLARALGIRNKN